MFYTIETSQGFVKTFKTIGGEMNEVTAYTNDRNIAYQFTKKSLAKLTVRSFFKYHSMKIVITEVN